MSDRKDFLDEFIAEEAKKNPKFPAMVAEALERRRAKRERMSTKTKKSSRSN